MSGGHGPRPLFVIIDDLPSDEPIPAETRDKIVAWYRDAVDRGVEVADR